MIRYLIHIFQLILVIFFSNQSFSDDTLKILTISEGLRLVTDNNRLIKIASLNKNIASSDILIARAKLLPSINASLRQTYLSHQIGAIFGQDKVFISEIFRYFCVIILSTSPVNMTRSVTLSSRSKTFLDV